jgi:hypothetical protein
MGNTCKSDEEIEKLLRIVYFTLYTLSDRVSYDHFKENVDPKPYITKDLFQG